MSTLRTPLSKAKATARLPEVDMLYFSLAKLQLAHKKTWRPSLFPLLTESLSLPCHAFLLTRRCCSPLCCRKLLLHLSPASYQSLELSIYLLPAACLPDSLEITCLPLNRASLQSFLFVLLLVRLSPRSTLFRSHLTTTHKTPYHLITSLTSRLLFALYLYDTRLCGLPYRPSTFSTICPLLSALYDLPFHNLPCFLPLPWPTTMPAPPTLPTSLV